MATVVIAPEAAKQAFQLPKNIQKRVRRLMKRLEIWPDVSGAKPLSGNLAGWYRLRTGDYRLMFFVVREVVTVTKIGHRKDFYDD